MDEIKVTGILLRNPLFTEGREALSWDEHTLLIPKGEQYEIEEDPLLVLAIHPGDALLPYGGGKAFSYGSDDAPWVTVLVQDSDKQVAFFLDGLENALALGQAHLVAHKIMLNSPQAMREINRMMISNAHLIPMVARVDGRRGDMAMMMNLIIARYGNDDLIPASGIRDNLIMPSWRKGGRRMEILTTPRQEEGEK